MSDPDREPREDSYGPVVEELMRENELLEPRVRVPLSHFALSASALEKFRHELQERELNVLRGIERERLSKLIQADFLKTRVWDAFSTKYMALKASESELEVRNFPLSTEEASSLSSFRSRSEKGDKERKLHSIFKLDCDETILSTTQFIQGLKLRLKSDFNQTFLEGHQRKCQIIQEAQDLLSRWTEIRRFLREVAPEEEMSSIQTLSKDDLISALPEWDDLERPERFMQVFKNEVSVTDWSLMDQSIMQLIFKEDDSGAPATRDSDDEDEEESLKYWSHKRESFATVSAPQKADLPLDRPKLRSASQSTVSSSRPFSRKRVGQLRGSFSSTLQDPIKASLLQLDGIKSALHALNKEIEDGVKGLARGKVQVDEGLLVYDIISFQLNEVLFQKKKLAEKLEGFGQEIDSLEEKMKNVLEEESQVSLDEAKAKSQLDSAARNLREEEASTKKALMSLPVPQFAEVMTLYRTKRITLRDPSDTDQTKDSHWDSIGEREVQEHQSRPTSPSRDLVDELEMPPDLVGGLRMWRTFLRCLKRRQEILNRIDDLETGISLSSSRRNVLAGHKEQLEEQIKQARRDTGGLRDELRALSEDSLVVLILPKAQVRISPEEDHLVPRFEDAVLLPRSELDACIQEAETSSKGQQSASSSGTQRLEAEKLRREKQRLQTQVELSLDELHQLNSMKVDRELQDTTAGREDKRQDPVVQFSALQKLQEVMSHDLRVAQGPLGRLDARIKLKRRRLGQLQLQADLLKGEVERLRDFLEGSEGDLQDRLTRVMKCHRMTHLKKRRRATIRDLEDELHALRLRTYPMLKGCYQK